MRDILPYLLFRTLPALASGFANVRFRVTWHAKSGLHRRWNNLDFEWDEQSCPSLTTIYKIGCWKIKYLKFMNAVQEFCLQVFIMENTHSLTKIGRNHSPLYTLIHISSVWTIKYTFVLLSLNNSHKTCWDLGHRYMEKSW